jgi:hypothetical protein
MWLRAHKVRRAGFSGLAEPAAGERDGYAALSLQVRRQQRLLWLAGGVAVLATAGLVASQWVKSPAEVAAETAPPTPTVITAPVSYGMLRSTVVFRGTFSSGRIVSFTPSAEVAPGGSGPAAQSLVVSRIDTAVGARVSPGEVLLGISDRPLFVLAGAVPAFRDMVQGESGQDIAELQAALGEIGYSCAGDPLGTFGAATAAAVRQFYATIGFGVPLVEAAPAAGSGGSGAGKKSAPRQLVVLPMSEVMFIPSFPATVTALPGTIGDQVASPLVSVALGEPDLTGQLDPANAGEVRAGMHVQVLSNTTGRHVSGLVTSVGQVVSPGQGNSPYLPVRIRPLRPWRHSWAGQDVQLTVTSAATSGPVLAVPEAAISAGADAVTYVTVAEAHGATRRVRVRAGVSVDGLVAVVPVAGGLAAGDRVVVGG